MTAERPIGRRYSHVYLDPGEPVYESQRLQARVAAYLRVNTEGADALIQALNLELGARLATDAAPFRLEQYFSKARTSDFLEAITVVARAYAGLDLYRTEKARRSRWIAFVERAMTEENSKFELDEQGGVHPRIDAEFTVAKIAAVRGLAHPRYRTARGHFDAAHAALDERPAATNRSVREVFMANEEVFKILVPSAKRLDGGEVTSKLNAVITKMLDGSERDAALGMTRAVVDYIAASHTYRHAQGEPEQAPVSLETATFMIGTGTALLRWLMWLDGRGHAAPDPTGGTAAGVKIDQ